ncbi:MAG: hypothetical protein WDM86_09880 [Rhizomicrobium sp.]
MGDIEQAAARFNAEAARHGWGQFCDPANAFLMPECGEVSAMWTAAAPAGGLPGRGAMTARRLKPYLPRLVLVELVQAAPPRLRFRLVGTLVANTLSERTGTFFDDPGATPQQTARWTQSALLALGARRPLRFFMRTKNDVTGEMVCLPLCDEAGQPRFVLTYGCYDPLRDWSAPDAGARLRPIPAESASPAG